MCRLEISLITACYNSVETLPDTLATVRRQRGVSPEYIVVDGASVDGTVGLIEEADQLISNWVSEPDNGMYDALNKGICRAQGDVIGFLHSDDLFAHEHVLARIREAFEDPAVDACYGDLVYVRRNAPERIVRYWRPGKFRRDRLARGWMPPHPTLYIRRELYVHYGGFDTRYRIASDYDCILRFLSKLRGKIVYIPEVMIRMRLGGVSNNSLGNIFLKLLEDYRALRANRVGGVGALAWKNISKLGQFIAH